MGNLAEAPTMPPPAPTLHDRLMSAAVTAGMPGLDASAAAANVLAVLRHVVETSCEARETRVGATYRFEQQHAEAMLRVLVGGGL